MFHYRIYLLTIYGRIDSGADANCNTDQDACALAQLMLNDSNTSQAEVWTGIRCVGRVAAASTVEA